MVDIYSGMLLSLRKEGDLAICNNLMNLENTMLSEISQSQKGEGSVIPLYEEYKIVRLIETENRTVLPRAWEGVVGSCCSKTFSLASCISSKDLLYSIVIIVNITLLYT